MSMLDAVAATLRDENFHTLLSEEDFDRLSKIVLNSVNTGRRATLQVLLDQLQKDLDACFCAQGDYVYRTIPCASCLEKARQRGVILSMQGKAT